MIRALSHHARCKRRKLSFQVMERRELLAGDLPLGATPVDTGEFFLGTVTVTPVFFESDGSIDPSTEDWDQQQIDATLDKIDDSLAWWDTLLASQTDKHTLDFVVDDTYALDPVETGYEPIERVSSDFELYVSQWLIGLGYGDAPSLERAVHLFNDSQRQKYNTDWAFTIFVVDSSQSEADGDGFFPAGDFRGAFAFAGGLFVVVPSERPTSTYSHEIGHIFWARDEYQNAGNWTDRRGYYNAQNLNAWDNPNGGQQISIMGGGTVASAAFDAGVTPESTLALIGWRDSDGDGIFDVADVPLNLDAMGSFDTETSVYTFAGSASVQTLPNQNSSGQQSDITLAKISEIQYRLMPQDLTNLDEQDNAIWRTASVIGDQTHAEFDLQIPISESFEWIEWRAIDLNTTNTSDIVVGEGIDPVFSGAGGGFAYVDWNQNGQRDLDEPLLDGTQFTIRNRDGSDVMNESMIANQAPEGIYSPPDGISLEALGTDVDGRVAALPGRNPDDGLVFQNFFSPGSLWIDAWSDDRRLEVTSTTPTGRVQIDFTALDVGTYGMDDGSYARAEAFDVSGNRIARVTSEHTAAGSDGQLVIEDPDGRITRVVIYGHAETEILISAVELGESRTMTGSMGMFSVDRLGDGLYSTEVVSPNLIYDFGDRPINFEVSDGTLPFSQGGGENDPPAHPDPLAIRATRVDSPRHNVDLPGDVDKSGAVTPVDALAVINDIARLGDRVLTIDEVSGLSVDVNNDGIVSPIDALRVINLIESGGSGEGEFVARGSRTDGGAATQDSLSSSAVDAFFSSPVSSSGSRSAPGARSVWLSNRNNSQMLNSAGQRTSDASSPVETADSSGSAVVPRVSFIARDASDERPDWEILCLSDDWTQDSNGTNGLDAPF